MREKIRNHLVLDKNCPLIKAISGLACDNCGYRKNCLNELRLARLHVRSLYAPSDGCPGCKAPREMFVYDSRNNEITCTVCGLVQADEAPIEKVPVKRAKLLGNPADDKRFLSFLRKRRRRRIVRLRLKPKRR